MRWLVLVLCLWAGPVLGAESKMLTDHLDLPDWLSVRGINQSRYESLNGQFRAGLSGSDQALFMRTVLLVEADTGPVTFGIELQDSRAYFDDSDSALSSSLVNPLDVLQAYGRFEFEDENRTASLTLGRQTIDIGARRWVARNGFRNAINAFTGAHFDARWTDGRRLHVFGVVPVGREPGELKALVGNTLEFDRERFYQRLWAVHYIHPDAIGDVQLDLFVYGFDENDSDRAATPDRRFMWPGLRLFRRPRPGYWDMDIEGAYRFGRRSASSSDPDTRALRVRTAALHAELGYTFDAPWRPRLAVAYDLAGGDGDPDDSVFGTWEPLFQARRKDLGHSSLHGPINRSNLNAPGAILEVKPSSRTDSRIAYNAAYLDGATDVWDIPNIIDPTGDSGRFVGHSLNGRIRHWVIPKILRAEIGGSALLLGRFAETAPNVTGEGDAYYGYVQLTTFF